MKIKNRGWLVCLLLLALIWGAWSSYQNLQLRHEYAHLEDDLGNMTARVAMDSSEFLFLAELSPDMTDQELDLFRRQVEMMSSQAWTWGLGSFAYYYESMLYAMDLYNYSPDKDKAALIQSLQDICVEFGGLLDLVLAPASHNGRSISIDSSLWFKRMRGEDANFNRITTEYILSQSN